MIINWKKDDSEEAYEAGKAAQKALLEEITITESGTYEKEDGYDKVIVDVHSGSYDEGYADGKEAQKALMDVLEIPSGTTSYDVSREDGYNRVVVATLTLSDRHFTIDSAEHTVTFSITSNWQWKITTDEDWLSFSQTSGSGNATVTVTVDEYDTTGVNTRYANITVSTQYGKIVRSNVDILQYHTNDMPEDITKVNHIYSTSSSTADSYYLTTSIIPSGIKTRIRAKMKFRYVNGTMVIGCATSGGEQYDYRMFYNTSSTYFDFGNGRINKTNSSLKSGDRVFTFGNYYIYEDTYGLQASSTARTSAGFTPTTGIRFNIYSWSFSFAQIFEDNELVFDGVAAVNADGKAGFYDKVSQTFVMVPNEDTLYD